MKQESDIFMNRIYPPLIDRIKYKTAILWMKLTKKRYIVVGSCRQCGQCCRELCLKIDGDWTRSEDDFNQLVKNNPNYARFHILEKDSRGYLWFYCDRLGPDGRCTDYENRLRICRDYPKASLRADGQLFEGCGYRIIKTVPFKRYLDLEVSRTKGNSSG